MLLKNICIISSVPFCLFQTCYCRPRNTRQKMWKKKKFSVSNQGFELLLYYCVLLISEDKWRNCKSREMKATVAKKRKARRRKQSKGGKHCLVICSTHCQTMANLLNTQKEDYTVVENHPKSLIFS